MGVDVIGIQRVEVRIAAKHPSAQDSSHNEGLSVLNVSRAEVEKPCSKVWSLPQYMTFLHS